MAYASFIDLYKQATTTPLDDFVYTIGVGGSSGTTVASLPEAHAQTRNLGVKWRRTGITGSGPVVITLESTNALLAADTHLMPQVVAILGHNLSYSAVIDVETHFRVGSVVTRSHIFFNNPTDKFNNDFFVMRRRTEDVPYKVVIYIYTSTGTLDIGRIWAGPIWDLGTPGVNRTSIASQYIVEENLVQETPRTLGMAQGAESDLTTGNQSYSNNDVPFKTTDVTLVTKDESKYIGEVGKPLDETQCMLNLINTLEQGGEMILIPRDWNDPSNANTQDQLWSNRVGIYGESAKASHEIRTTGTNQWQLDLKLRELL